MDVPWQCQRCSLHNISNICAACSAPRPDPMSNDSDEERASLLGRSPDGARPPAVPSRFSGSRSRFGGPDVGDAAGGTSPDELGPIPGGAGFNPAELPQEFTGIGQQQPPEVPLPPRNGFLGIPGQYTVLSLSLIFPCFDLRAPPPCSGIHPTNDNLLRLVWILRSLPCPHVHAIHVSALVWSVSFTLPHSAMIAGR